MKVEHYCPRCEHVFTEPAQDVDAVLIACLTGRPGITLTRNPAPNGRIPPAHEDQRPY